MPTKPVLLLTAAAALILAAVPMVVNAEGGPPPPQPTPIRIDPPLIRGVNTHAAGEEVEQTDLAPSEFSAGSTFSTALLEAPAYLPHLTLPPAGRNVPSHSTPAADVGCGPRALAGVLEALEGQEAPTGDQLLADLRGRGLLYEWGTGVEELAYLARLYGFSGSLPFHGSDLDQIKVLLEQGIPVIAALGDGGDDGPGHFVTVAGFSEDDEWIWVDDPSLGLRPLRREAFKSAWAAQGNAGLQVSRERTASGPDPLLPWIGLLGMVSALTVLAGNQTFSRSSRRTLERLRGLLGSRSRKGIGGRLAEPDKVILGWKSAAKEIPVYEWRKVQTGTREVKVEEPVYSRLKVQVGTKTRVKKVPVYVRKKIQVGTREVHKLVKVQGRKRRVVTRWKKVVRRVPVYKRFGWTRIRVGTRREVSWKKVRQVKWVPCTHLKRITEQVPVYEEIQVQQGWKEMTEEVPIYEWHRVQSGTRTVTRSKPVYEDKKFRVGTRTVTEKVPVYAGDQEPDGREKAPSLPKTTVEYLKSLDKAREDPEPNTTVEYLKELDEHFDGIITHPKTPNLASDYLKSIGKSPSTASKVPNKSTWQKFRDFLVEHVIIPYQKYSKRPEGVFEDIPKKLIPPFLTLSADEKWDLLFWRKDEVVFRSISPPNILGLFYVSQKLKGGEKAVVNFNPGGFIDFSITSGNGSVNLLNNLSYLFGPNEYGIKIKDSNQSTGDPYDYENYKHTLSLSINGITYSYKHEGVVIINKDEKKNIEAKLVKTIEYKKTQIKTEGILFLTLAIALAIEFGLLLAASEFGLWAGQTILNGH